MMEAHNPTYATSFYTISQEQIASIWEQRARQAARLDAVEKTGEQMIVVLVRLGDELLGLEAEFVSDIRATEALARVPRAPQWALGLVHLREQLLPVVDLRRFLGLPPAGMPGPGAFITVEAQGQKMVFYVDDVPGAEALPVLEDLAGTGTLKNCAWRHLPASCARAIVERWAGPQADRAEPQTDPTGQPYILVIDTEALLSDPRLNFPEALS